jgi:hypothetical protein
MASNSSSRERRNVAEQGKIKGKEIEVYSPVQPILNKGRRIQFTDEPKETQTPNGPTTRSAARRIPTPTMKTNFVEAIAQEMDEDQVESGEKYSEVREIQQQLREAQHVIAQFYQERRELKRNLPEKALEAHKKQAKADPKREISKGKGVLQSPDIGVTVNPSTPLTRSSARKKGAYVQGQHEATEIPHTSLVEA